MLETKPIWVWVGLAWWCWLGTLGHAPLNL